MTPSGPDEVITAADLLFGSTEGGIALDRVRFEQVPEPSTFMLTMLGLVGVRRARRNRRTPSALVETD